MSFSDVEAVLSISSLIDGNNDQPTISIPRLTQAEVMRNQTDVERGQNFSAVVRVLSWAFPNTWSQDVGHQIQTWENCERCLPHVRHLVEQHKRYGIKPERKREYGEPLLQCGWCDTPIKLSRFM